MTNRTLFAVVVLALLFAGAYAAASNAGLLTSDTSPPQPTLPPVVASDTVIADGRVVPVRSATLSFPIPGEASEILAVEGEPVAADDPLIRLADAELRVAVTQAQADLRAAEAQLAKTVAGPTDPEIAAARAAVDAARGQVLAAGGSVAGAQAGLNRVSSGATEAQVAIAQRQLEQTRNELWGAQNRRDAICGRSDSPFYEPADCDGAEAAVAVAEEQVRIAELQLSDLQAGARGEDVSAARAQVGQSQGQLTSAEAQLAEAEARLAQLLAGATAEDIALADARVLQAQATYDQARLRLDQATLKAPFDGVVAAVRVDAGERVTPGTPVLEIADLSAWRIETEDLTELGVVDVTEGDRATVTFDALPDLELSGRVVRVRPLGENRQGDIVYTVVVAPDRHEPRLRWNMTASVEIGGE